MHHSRTLDKMTVKVSAIFIFIALNGIRTIIQFEKSNHFEKVCNPPSGKVK